MGFEVQNVPEQRKIRAIVDLKHVRNGVSDSDKSTK